ncbi:inhibitor of growth protein 3-like [Orbicella faveolata]|uniref:inhibitor of growth protein 3-like n=1 Tax=Orbicella faveolata TaxID=48498 RepID=UPI0009E1C197|nr:inhibitor of growth protein 3-like [Orbicella faveolata]
MTESKVQKREWKTIYPNKICHFFFFFFFIYVHKRDISPSIHLWLSPNCLVLVLYRSKSSTQVTAVASAQVAEQEAAVAVAAVSDWVYDPNEPRYCLCNQVSYGEMVGCDNPDCAIEWFHYGCVGLTDAPKGKWFCPQCQNQMKQQRRGGRHK